MTLGLVLSPYGKVPGAFPYEIARSDRGNKFLCPPDPYYYQRGETGLFYDTQLGFVAPKLSLRERVRRFFRRADGVHGLGAIPTDAEIGKNTYAWYTPVQSAWIYSAEGYLPPPWVPPNGWHPGGQFGPKAAPLNGLGLTAEEAQQAIITELSEHHKRQFQLSALSTAVVVASSIITLYRTVSLIRDDRERRKAEAK